MLKIIIIINFFYQVDGCEKVCCYWFIGLKVELKEGNTGGQLDLTTPIKAFTDIVMRSAIQINVWKTGMKEIILKGLVVTFKFLLRHENSGRLQEEEGVEGVSSP